jgi:hypothetical protein
MRGEMITKIPDAYIKILIATGGEVMEANPELVPPRVYRLPNAPEKVHREDRAWSRSKILDFLWKWNIENTAAYRAAEFFHKYNPNVDVEARINELSAYFRGEATSLPLAKTSAIPPQPFEIEGFSELTNIFSQKFLQYIAHLAQTTNTALTGEVREAIQQGIVAMQEKVVADFHGQAEDFFTQLRADYLGALSQPVPVNPERELDTLQLIETLHERLLIAARSADMETRNEFAATYSEELSRLLELVNAFTLSPQKREIILSVIQNL